MATRVFQRSLPILRQPTHMQGNLHSQHFSSSARRLESAIAPLPVKRPVGAFRGGLIGFLSGAVLAGSGTFYYVMEEYRVSNELLTEDIYALQAAVQRMHSYVSTLEEKVDLLEKRKK